MHLAHNLVVPAHFGLRTDRYKLMFIYGTDYEGKNRLPAAWEFYDLKNDPFENTNQYGNPEYKEIISGLKGELKQLRIDLDETDADYPAIRKVIEARWDD
jgi:uncharacterized sulfatase